MNLLRYAENKTIYDNYIIQYSDKYYCTQCKKWHAGTKRSLKKHTFYDNVIKYQCKCGTISPLKYGDKHNLLNTVSHIAAVYGNDNLHVDYYRLEKSWYAPDWECSIILHPVIKDHYKNNQLIRHTNDIAKGMGWTDNYYLRSYTKKWKKATSSQYNINFDRIYIASERTANTSLKYFNLKRYANYINKNELNISGFWLDRLISTYNYEYEILQKQGNMQLIFQNYDKNLYKQYKYIIKRYQLDAYQIKMLRYTRDIKNIRYFSDYYFKGHLYKSHDMTKLRLYLTKQQSNPSFYDDYIDMVKEYYSDIKSYKYPDNLKQSHDNLVECIKVKENKLYDKAIKSVAAAGIVYRNNMFIISPFKTSKEIIEEGNKLHHCVAHYIEKYASNKTQLYKVRKISDPSTPFITVEVTQNEIRQVYGVNNSNPSIKVKEFLKEIKEINFKP